MLPAHQPFLTMTNERRGPRPWMIALVAIFLLAIVLRTLGLAYGLPAVYNPDERPILNRALAFAKGDPNPHNFLYPSLYFYAVFAWEVLFFVVGRVAGLFGSLADFQREFFTDPSRLFLAARAFTAVCGTLTALALYWFGRRLYGRAAGLAAALFYAVAPVAVRDAHYVKLDVPVTLFVALTHAALARIVVDADAASRRRAWIVAGLLGGLAISTHYYVGLIVFSFVAAALADLRRSGRWQQSLRLLAWAAAGVIAGFFAGTPFMLAEPGTAVRDIVAVREIDIDRAVVGGAFVSVGPYLEMLLRDALGWPVFLAACAGLVWAIARDWRRGLLLATFPVLFFGFCANTVPMSRYLNAMLPSLALAAAFALTSAVALLDRRARIAMPAVIVAAALPGFLGSLRTDLFLRQADTRTIAREFMEAHIPPSSSILVQPYSVPLEQSHEGLVEALSANLGSVERASVKFQLQLAAYPKPRPTYRMIYLGDGGLDEDKIYVSPAVFAADNGLAPLRSLGIDFVVLKRHNTEDPAMQHLSADLHGHGQLIAEFSPYRPGTGQAVRARVAPFLHNTAARIAPELERPGPIIEIWKLNSSDQNAP